MKKFWILLIGLVITFSSCAVGSGEKIIDVRTDENSALAVSIEPGEEYLHEFPLFLFFKLKNPPQIAVWAETAEGEYIDTLFVTRKSGTQGWLKASGDPLDKDMIRRPESLPVWAWKRNMPAADGLPMPTKDQPMTDAVSHASPERSFSLITSSVNGYEEFVIYLEINHSTDFNQKYRAELKPGDPDYNGGEFGSGQPSLVYKAVVKSDTLDENGTALKLIGHGSADGEDGRINEDLNGIESALNIIKSARVYLKEN